MPIQRGLARLLAPHSRNSLLAIADNRRMIRRHSFHNHWQKVDSVSSRPVSFSQPFKEARAQALLLRAAVKNADQKLSRQMPNSMGSDNALQTFLTALAQSTAAERQLHQEARILATDGGLSPLSRRPYLTDQLFFLINSGVKELRVDVVELEWPLTTANHLLGHDGADLIKFNLIRKFLDEEFAPEKKSMRAQDIISASGGSFFLVHAQNATEPLVLSPERLARLQERLNAALEGYRLALAPTVSGMDRARFHVNIHFSRTTCLKPLPQATKKIHNNRREFYSNLKFVVSGILAGGLLPQEVVKNASLVEVNAQPPSPCLPKFIPDLDHEGKDIRVNHILGQQDGTLRVLEGFVHAIDPTRPENQQGGGYVHPFVGNMKDIWMKAIDQASGIETLALHDPGFPWFYRREALTLALDALFQQRKGKAPRYFCLGFADVNHWYAKNQESPVTALDTEFYKMLRLHQQAAPTAAYAFKKSRSDELIFAFAGLNPISLMGRVNQAYRKVFPTPVAVYAKVEKAGQDVRVPLFQLKGEGAEKRSLEAWQKLGKKLDDLEPVYDFLGETAAIITHIPWALKNDEDSLGRIIAHANEAVNDLKDRNRRGEVVTIPWAKVAKK